MFARVTSLALIGHSDLGIRARSVFLFQSLLTSASPPGGSSPAISMSEGPYPYVAGGILELARMWLVAITWSAAGLCMFLTDFTGVGLNNVLSPKIALKRETHRCVASRQLAKELELDLAVVLQPSFSTHEVRGKRGSSDAEITRRISESSVSDSCMLVIVPIAGQAVSAVLPQ